MDHRSRRERMQDWIAVGVREGLTFKQLAKRAGVSERTLREWNKLFRQESARRAAPDCEEDAFVELVERTEINSSRIEVVLPGERRIVINGTAIVEALVRVIMSIERC
jgi:transposase